MIDAAPKLEKFRLRWAKTKELVSHHSCFIAAREAQRAKPGTAIYGDLGRPTEALLSLAAASPSREATLADFEDAPGDESETAGFDDED